MKDIDVIRRFAEIVQKHVSGVFVEEEPDKKGSSIFIGTNPVTDDQQSIHMCFMFDGDNDMIGIG